MIFSVSLPLLRDLASRDPYRDTFRLANIAEEAGFDTLTIGQHHFLQGNPADPLTIIMGSVATRTSTIRVGTGIFILPLEHVHVAFGIGMPAGVNQSSIGGFEEIAEMMRLYAREVIYTFKAQCGAA